MQNSVLSSICYVSNIQNTENVTTVADLTLTMFQPRLKSGGAGVVDRFGRDTVYELVVEVLLE